MTHRSFALFLFLSLGISAWAGDEPAAQLLLPSRQLEPKSTFEVRFASAMVAADQIGKTADVSPLVFQPPVEGRFVWLSTRSGTFAPTNILPLGTKFQITLRSDLKDVAGKNIGAALHETAETPPLRVKGTSFTGMSGGRDLDNASMIPRLLILFNANVEAKTVAKFIRFEDAAHNRVAARVEPADPKTNSFPRWESDDRNLDAWSAQPVPEETEETSDLEEDENALVEKKTPPARGNVLFVTPVKPLSPARNWRLVIDKGIPASEWKTTMPATREVMLGTVQKFAVKQAKAEGNRTDGRRIIVEFTKAVAEELSAETVGRWIRIEPAPANLKTIIGEDRVTLRGDFSLGTRYRVSVATGLPAREPTQTSAPFKQEVAFEKFDSRLYFQDITAHQYLGGTRQLRLLSVNVPRIRISARIFTGTDVAAAVKAFDAYEERPEDLPDEMYTRVKVESLGGKVIWEKEITPGGAVDSQQIVPLNWDEMVGKNHGGAVVFTAESVDPVGPDGKRVGTQTLMQLTDLGAVWKRDPDGTFLHVFSLASGKGISGARAQLIDAELKPLDDGTTDEDGDVDLSDDHGARWVFLQTNDDAHLVALSSSENFLSLYHFGLGLEGSDDDAEGRYAKTVFLFTERGVYKPGDKLHLKGYAQDPRNDEPRLPAGKELTITINDAKEREIFSKKVTLSEFGSFDLETTLPNGSLGRYSIVAAGEKGERLGGYCSFQVQEYKPNAFEILIPPPPRHGRRHTTGAAGHGEILHGQTALESEGRLVAGRARSTIRAGWPFRFRFLQRHLRFSFEPRARSTLAIQRARRSGDR